MILRSQLRMNKNILFPFISCILIMLTLLVLIHKSADELNSVKKELGLCKQKHELASTQLQNAIDYKLRLEQSLENEKTKGKEHYDEVQSKLNQEQEDRRKEKEDLKKEKEDLNSRYENVKHELESLKNENQDLKDENSKLNTQLEQVQLDKDTEIKNLKDKIIIFKNMQIPNQKVAIQKKPTVAERVDLVQSASKGSITPGINPQALVEPDEMKQVAPPPNNVHDMVAQEMMRKSLDMRSGDDLKMDENVIKAPMIKPDIKKVTPENVERAPFLGDDKKVVENVLPADDKNEQRILPLPYAARQKASSASNNAAEVPLEDQGDNPPAPALNAPREEKEKQQAEIPKHMNNYPGGDEDEDDYGNEIGEKNAQPKKDA